MSSLSALLLGPQAVSLTSWHLVLFCKGIKMAGPYIKPPASTLLLELDSPAHLFICHLSIHPFIHLSVSL